MENLPNDTLVYLSEIQGYVREMRDYVLEIRDCVLRMNNAQQQARPPGLTERKLLDIEEVLDILHIGRSTYYRFVNTGKLVPRKIGERHCYYLEDLEDMIQESKRRGRI
ncbi:helix-turn-helix transcriptional regulator [Sphingobacterium paucimobilis]|uniref:Helix-turn-helix domain-containing protein n=1 Tax=Sphingobacterium paucimobilis HER1398 TaxID=1346330 RepID=U2JF55_9SPHI|nr:helix-turn-helix domain-containing protein [Sphingobacterium paucimobilis]ERJ61308.1 hypothetical protein M472_21370 [Sphingobacterium paucimobilis HER1398]